MSSIARRLEKALLKKKGIECPDLPQSVRNISDHGYEVLHPTKGWRKVSANRVYAQNIVAYLKGGR